MSDLIELMYATQPVYLHEIIHIMRIAQQKIFDLITETNHTVNGTGLHYYNSPSEVPESQFIIKIDNDDGKVLAMSYEITSAPVDDIDCKSIRHLLSKLITIDDDYDNASLESIKQLDLSAFFA